MVMGGINFKVKFLQNSKKTVKIFFLEDFMW